MAIEYSNDLQQHSWFSHCSFEQGTWPDLTEKRIWVYNHQGYQGSDPLVVDLQEISSLPISSWFAFMNSWRNSRVYWLVDDGWWFQTCDLSVSWDKNVSCRSYAWHGLESAITSSLPKQQSVLAHGFVQTILMGNMTIIGIPTSNLRRRWLPSVVASCSPGALGPGVGLGETQ